MNRKLLDALNEISDSHIAEAAEAKRRRRPILFAATAAALVLVLTAGLLYPGFSSNTPDATPTNAEISATQPVQTFYALSAPAYPELAQYPLDYQEYNEESLDNWREDQNALHTQPEGYADNLDDYFSSVTEKLLTDTNGDNAVCSPVNIYIALAMLAESTDGASRQQILDALNADSIVSLRTQANHVWRGHYNDDGLTTSILANSLWLEDGYTYNKDTVQLLSDNYYASVFQGDLGSEEINQALRDWINQQTGGLLQEQTKDIKLDTSSVLALASTLYYQVQWMDPFQEEANTENTFHGTAGDQTLTFMNRSLTYGPYYWSDHFGAVSIMLEDSSRMWLILPDSGTSPEQLLESGEAMDFLRQDPNEYENQKSLLVNLSVPKFDISSDIELRDQLKALGITAVFEPGIADFTPIIPTADGGYVDQIKHAARVSINEEGVTAAAFTLIMRAGAGMPPEEEMDFILDRPFLFVIESQDGLPLFAGIVNNP